MRQRGPGCTSCAAPWCAPTERLGGPGVAAELDETWVGGRAYLHPRARFANKTEVAIAVERQHPRGLGRVRMRHISRNGKDDIEAIP
jgi:hypothetical protein